MKAGVLALCAWLVVGISAVAAETLQRDVNTYATHVPEMPRAHSVDVPALTAISITVVRLQGSCDVKLRAGTGVRGHGAFRRVANVEASFHERVRRASIVVLPPAQQSRRLQITFDKGSRDCRFRSYVIGSHIGEKAAEAFAMSIVQLMLENMVSSMLGDEPGDLTGNPIVTRGIGAGMAVLMNDNLAAAGAAAMLNEIQARVSQAIPESHALAVFVTHTLSGLMSDLYDPYFKAQSASYR